MQGGPAIGIGLLFGFFIMLFVSSLFGMLGGLFGALMFRKSPPPVIPPPIPPPSSFYARRAPNVSCSPPRADKPVWHGLEAGLRGVFSAFRSARSA